jgi:hypothetical protein
MRQHGKGNGQGINELLIWRGTGGSARRRGGAIVEKGSRTSEVQTNGSRFLRSRKIKL